MSQEGINRFAFVIHPLNVDFIHRHPWFRWSRYLPDWFVETVGAWFPPFYISTMRGGRSPATGQRIEGILYTLGATPSQMMRHRDRFTYSRLIQAARMAQRRGARIIGLGAFTSVVGDAGISIAQEVDIGVTTGNSLTVSTTLEVAKQAMALMGWQDLAVNKSMVIGATGAVGSGCARCLAQMTREVTLVSVEPQRLNNLKSRIEQETPGANVHISGSPDDVVGDHDLIITATTAIGQRVVDLTHCKPGAVICDVARPSDISPAEAALRPDVLVIDSGEVMIPGDVDFGYDIGLPPKTAYACLAETALLAMEGRFEDYTLGRNISIEQIDEITRLFNKHHFQMAGLRSLGQYITVEDIAEKRRLADQLCSNPDLFSNYQQEAASRLKKIPPMAKGIRAKSRMSS